MSTWEQVAKHTHAEFVGGDLLARIDNKNVTLGRKVGSTVVLTLEGEAVAAELHEVKKTATRKAIKDAKHEPDPTVEDELANLLDLE